MRAARVGALFAALALTAAVPATAAPYGIGNRWFPATPLVDTPFVADALYAGVQHLRQPGSPNFGENAFNFGFERRITAAVGVTLAETYDLLTPRGQDAVYGFDNLYAAVKYQAFESEPHEAAVSFGVVREFGGTGAARVGAEAIGFTTPSVYVAKGFGDVSAKFLRPFAVTGSFGVQIADSEAGRDEHFPKMAELGVSLQYSLHYLQGNVEYVGLPPFLDRLIPVIEFIYSTPLSTAFGTPATGIVAPGVVYSNNGLDLSLEAMLPINRQSGVGIGVIARTRIPLDRIAAVFDAPLFGD